MGRKYKNPPIVEALCEFHFEPGVPWDLVIPGLVYERLKGDFGKRRQARVLKMDVAVNVETFQQQARTMDRMQFWREDEKALVQVGPNFLAVNHLKPYPSWEGFRPIIENAFTVYQEITKPQGINRIVLQYINQVDFAEQRVELEEYFEFRPFIGSGLPQDHGAFIAGAEFLYENERDLLRLQISNAEPTPSFPIAVRLDLIYALAKPGAVDLNDVFEWVDTAHKHSEEVFEASITDHLRAMWGEVIE